MPKNGLGPGDVARELKRSVSWLRWLERQGIIEPPARDPLSGHRIYGPEDVERIREAVINRRKQAALVS